MPLGTFTCCTALRALRLCTNEKLQSKAALASLYTTVLHDCPRSRIIAYCSASAENNVVSRLRFAPAFDVVAPVHEISHGCCVCPTRSWPFFHRCKPSASLAGAGTCTRSPPSDNLLCVVLFCSVWTNHAHIILDSLARKCKSILSMAKKFARAHKD